MGTATWTEIVDATTGRIYADSIDFERKTGIPAELVNACIETGKTINGHRFERVKRSAKDGTPNWAHTGDPARAAKATRARGNSRAIACDAATTPGDRARAVEMFERGVTLADISAALGVRVRTRDIARWNGGTAPGRPPGFHDHGQGRGITINNKRPSWENPSCATADGPEGAESGSSSPAQAEAAKSRQIKPQRPRGAETERTEW